MTRPPPGLALSDEDRISVDRVDALAQASGNVLELTARLDVKSWAVRRAVIEALARIGEPAVATLCELLVTQRDSEARIAAIVTTLSASRGDVETAMLALLETETAPAVLCDICRVLGLRRSEVAAPTLSRLSAHADDNVAVGALEALGWLSASGSIDALIAAVESRRFFRTFPAIAALAKTGHPRAVPPLAALLTDVHYASEAIVALGTTGQLSAAAPLATMLVSPNDATVRLAAGALGALATTVGARTGDDRAVQQTVSALATTEAATRIAAAMADATDEEVSALVVALAFVGDTHVAGLLEDASSARRLRLLSVLARPRAHISAVASCLRDRDPAVRALACDVLARAGQPSAAPALFALLGDLDARVALSAVGAIQSLGSEETKRLTLLMAVSQDPRVRRNALRILAYFGHAEGLELLVAAMSDDDPRIRDAAVQGLAFVEDPRAIRALVDATKHESAKTRAAAMRALGHTDAGHAGPVLRAALADDDAWVRYYACQSVAKLGIKSAEPDVIRLLDDPAGQVRLAAVEGLARFPGDGARLALEHLATSSDEDMRRAAIVGLGMLGRNETLPLLQSAAASREPATRLVALAALAELAHADVVVTLAEATNDSDESVQRGALSLLARRAGRAATEAILPLLTVPHLRDDALLALGTYADGRVEAILAALEVADAAQAPVLVGALVRLQKRASTSVLLAVLDLSNPHARRAVIGVLATAGTSEAIAGLERAALSDPDADVRRLALESRF
jgi:HEAT repeat protein